MHDDTAHAHVDSPLSPARPRLARSKIKTETSVKPIRLTLRRCFLLELPLELLTQIVGYLINPRNNQLFLMYFARMWARPRTWQAWLRAPDENEPNEFKPPLLYQPPILFVNRRLSDIASMILRRDVVLRIEVGHPLAAKVTLKSLHSLRPRMIVARDDESGVKCEVEDVEITKENRELAEERKLVRRLRATLKAAKGFQKLVVFLHRASNFSRSMTEQLEVVLDHLAVGADKSRRSWQLNKNYVAIEMEDWMKLKYANGLWASRRGEAADILEVLTKYRNVVGFGDRMIVDVRRAAGFQAIKRGPERLLEIDEQYDEIVEACYSPYGRLSVPLARFLNAFKGRQLCGGSVDWDVLSEDMGPAIFDSDEINEAESDVRC